MTGNHASAPLQLCYSAYGKTISRCPLCVWLASFLIFLILQIGWIPEVREGLGVELGEGFARAISDADFEQSWSTEDGDVVDDIQKWKTLRNKSWEYANQLTMFVGKGELKGKDILTPEVFDEVAPLLEKFHTLTVRTAANNTYSTWDLCARGAQPDIPGDAAACQLWAANNFSQTALVPNTTTPLAAACAGTPYMPCLIVAPQLCFSEYADIALHASYKVLDPNAEQLLPASLYPESFSNRPSYRSLTAAAMKDEVSKLRSPTNQRGCNYYTKLATYTPDVWGGRVSWNAGQTRVEKVPAFMWTLFLDGAARAAFRMKLSKPQHAVVDQMSEAITLFENRWQQEVEAFSRTSTLVEAVNMKWPTTFEEIEDQYKDFRYEEVVLGYALMLVFIIGVLFRCTKTLRHRWLVGVAGLMSVAMATSSAVVLFLLLGWKINVFMLVVLPFLGLGLGVNDMFVYIRHFSERAGEADNAVDVTCGMLAGAGPGAFLTSFCNFVTFTSGALLIPTPALSDFCCAAAIMVLVNYIAMLTQVAPLLSFIATWATTSSESDAHSCAARCSKVEESCKSSEKMLESKMAKISRQGFGAIGALLCVCAIALLVVSAILIRDKEVGYNPAEAVKTGTSQHRPVEVFFDEFSTFAAYLAFDNVDVPANQAAMLQLFEDITNQPLAEAFGPNYLTTWYLYLAQVAQLTGQMPPSNPSWISPTLAPFGTLALDSFYQQFHAWSRVPEENPLLALNPANQGFLLADQAWTNEFTYVKANRSLAPPLRYSFFAFSVVGLQNENDFVDAIRQVNAALDRSPLKGKGASVYGPIFSFWSVLLKLDETLWRILAVSLTAVWCCTLLCGAVSMQGLFSEKDKLSCCLGLCKLLAVAFISTLICAMIVLEIYGLSMIHGFLKFNAFVAMALLAACGMSVEYVAHLVMAFLQERGTAQQRTARALALTMQPILLGSLSTIVGILPMTLSSFTFVVKYVFGMFALVQIIGLINGLLFLPAFLGTLALLCDPNAGKEIVPPAEDDANRAAIAASTDLPSILSSPPSAERCKKVEQI